MQPGLKPNAKGKPRRGGRQRGTPNRISVDVRTAIEMAADKLGGVKRLVAWARRSNDNETVFWSRVWVRLLPTNVAGQVGVYTGEMPSEEESRRRMAQVIGLIAPELKDADDDEAERDDQVLLLGPVQFQVPRGYAVDATAAEIRACKIGP
jgi:hypothetical protein